MHIKIEYLVLSIAATQALHLLLRIIETEWNKQCLFILLLIEWSVCILPLVGETNNTRCSPWFADIFKFKKNLSQRYFRHQATVWWNSLPSTLFDDISNFCDGLLRHLLDHDLS